jgi:hydrophobe/amphiphile efflux-3 (HAE3) family protein
MADFAKAIEPLEGIAEVHFTGEMPFRDRVAYYLSKDFSFLLILALAAMLAIFWFSFRSVRSVVLPVLVVVIGAIWSLGFMSMMGFPITVVSVIIPSLILTMGSSYTIHVMNEYYRNLQEDHEVTDKKQWLADAVEHAIRTVIVAAVTTIVCFISLLTTTLQPLREFGLSISLGILFCAILALFFLPAVFVLLPAPKRHSKERIHNGFLTKTASKLGGWSLRNPILITFIFAALFAGTLLVYPHIRHQSDYFSYFPSEDRIIKDTNFINRYSGGSQTLNITLKAPEGKKGYFLDPGVLTTLDRFEAGLSDHPAVTNKLSFLGILKSMNSTVTGKTAVPESRGLILLLDRYFRMIPTGKFALGQGSSLISEDGSSITIYLKLAEAVTYNMINEDGVRDFISFVENRLASDFGDSLSNYLWGNTILLLDSSRVIMRDQLRSTALSMLLGVIITAIVFRSFTYSLFAVIPLFSGMSWYFITLYFSRIPMDLTTILVTNVTVGVGLDNAVHFILQYRIQRNMKNWQDALADSLKITGRPIVLTTVSLVAGLIMLCFASFKPVVYFGYLVAGALFSTMIGTLVFIPTAIVFREKILEWKNRRINGRENTAVLP